MRSANLITSAFLATVAASKRGLIGVNNAHSYIDQSTLIAGNATSWAYNYGTQPGNATWFGNLEFVPELWGGNAASTFEAEVLANSPATTHIFAFNEPDGQGSGQATMSPATAASIWTKYVEPLRAHGIKLGSPACTGSDGGIEWLKQFYGNCTGCHIDFIATHWYGDFQGLAAHLGNLYNVFNGTTMWVTELGIYDASATDSESMFNTSTAWLDGLSWVERYAWFGSFRSSDAGGAANATFLNSTGNLTRIGRDYLYSATGSNTSSTTTTTSAASSSSSSKATSKSKATSIKSTFSTSPFFAFASIIIASVVLYI